MSETNAADATQPPDPLSDPSAFAFQLLRRNVAASSLDARWQAACAQVVGAGIPAEIQALHALLELPNNASDKA